MFITEIIPTTKGKAKVCFEDGTDLTLYKKEIAAYHLTAEAELSDETFAAIEEEVLIPRAKKRAMHLLEQSDRTERQLRDKLAENGYSPNAIDQAIAYVASYHYIDDDRYARTYVQLHCTDKSRMRIRQDLLQRGLSDEQITAAIEAEYAVDEGELLVQLAKKKGFDLSTRDKKEMARIYRFFASKGYSAHVIMKAFHD